MPRLIEEAVADDIQKIVRKLDTDFEFRKNDALFHASSAMLNLFDKFATRDRTEFPIPKRCAREFIENIYPMMESGLFVIDGEIMRVRCHPVDAPPVKEAIKKNLTKWGYYRGVV